MVVGLTEIARCLIYLVVVVVAWVVTAINGSVWLVFWLIAKHCWFALRANPSLHRQQPPLRLAPRDTHSSVSAQLSTPISQLFENSEQASLKGIEAKYEDWFSQIYLIDF